MIRPAAGGGSRRISKSVLVCLLLAACAVAFARAPRAEGHVRETPEEILKQIGVDEKLGDRVSPDLVFRNEEGRAVRLGEFIGKGPLLLTLNYYTCPMLCPLTLRNLLSSLDRMGGISLERDFRIVTVSIDPEEKPEAARARAAEMHAMMKGAGNPSARWPFLAGGQGDIERLTAAVGFRYRKSGKEFAHPDVIVVLTPEGRISRYLYGIEQDPKDLRLALIEAAGGRIGESSAMNRALLFCFHYDPSQRKYALYARNIMKAGGIFTLAFLGVLYLALWKRRKAGAPPYPMGDR
ncbi:MAG: SCO family protein [Deltaproteobacteria bacterium]|nr:SCO family protein [Candidatus Deferrimicrobiaceae bacterium]